MMRTNLKKQFIIKNFISLFMAFIFPVILAGMILLFILFRESNADTDRRIEQSLTLVYDNIDQIYNNFQIIKSFTENTNLPILNRMMKSGDIDYADSLALKQYLSFISSFTGADSQFDSVYLYIDNESNRVFTSTSGFSFINSIYDSGWIDILTNSKKREFFTVREKQDYQFEEKRPVLSLFSNFNSYDGGLVLNYNLNSIMAYLESIKFFDTQRFIISDKMGNILISTENSEMTASDSKMFRKESIEYKKAGLVVTTMIENAETYKLFLNNARNIFIIISLLLIISLIFSYFLSLKRYNELSFVEQSFSNINQDKITLRCKSNDLYSRILQNIISVFLEKDYLKIQLSERKYRQKTAELLALQYQINPHFLYNALQTVNYEILGISEGQQTTANEMIENLSDIIRYSLTNPSALVRLQDEIYICDKYVYIQKIRYQNNFYVQWDIMDGNLLNNRVPCLILQPIIENSIIHGLRYKTEDSKIKIKIKYIGSLIKFSIYDNGTGIPEDQLRIIRDSINTTDSINYTNTHIGLINCNQRLVLRFGQLSKISIYSKQGKGTLVSFTIPMLNEKE